MLVTLQRVVISDPPAEVGRWIIRTIFEMAAVPRAGDFVEVAEGWSSLVVQSTTFLVNGDILVFLMHTKTDNIETLESLHDLVDIHGWRWMSRAPARR